MAHINCADCSKTYRPYSYDIALLRVLMYGFSDWWEFEDERAMREQFRECLRDRNKRSWLFDRTRKYSFDDSFSGDFLFYYQYLENKRRKTVSATFLCFDCEKYYCTNCVSKHAGHFTFSKDDKYNISKCWTINVEMSDRLKAEGDQKLENIRREHTYLCDVVNVRGERDNLYLLYVFHLLERNYGDERYELMTRKLDCLVNPRVGGLHILNDNKKWLVTDSENKCIKIFNVNNNKMTRRIKLSSSPWGITEIPSTGPSQSLIAVSLPHEEQIHIIDIHRTPAQVVSCIYVQGKCYDLAYCNNKLITRSWDFPEKKWRHSIHVMDMLGEIINIIDLHKLPSIKLKWFYLRCMCVHSESETIYVCHDDVPFSVTSLSLDGQVLHSVTFTDLEPELICVDREQNVYVTSHQLPIYKLSPDLRRRNKVIEENVVETPNTLHVTAMKFHRDKFYLVTAAGRVYILQQE